MTPQENIAESSRLSPILTRLTELGEPVQRSGQVLRLIDRFADRDPALNFKFEQSLAHYQQFAKEPVVGKKAKEEL